MYSLDYLQDCYIPVTSSYGIYNLKNIILLEFVYSVSDLNKRNIDLTVKLLYKGFRYHKLQLHLLFLSYRYTTLIQNMISHGSLSKYRLTTFSLELVDV